MSLTKRISLGMGVIIALMILVGAFAAFQTNKLAGFFMEYRGTAKTSLVAVAMAEDLAEARQASLTYRLTKDPTYISGDETRDGVNGNIDEIIANYDELVTRMDGYPEQAELTDIVGSLEEYRNSMASAYAKQKERDALVAQTVDLGRKARLQLSEIMDTASSDGDAIASAAAGVASTHLLLARVYLERFLVDNSAADAQRSGQEVSIAKDAMSALLKELQNPRRRELAEATINDLVQFESLKDGLVEVIDTRNAIYARMDIIGPETLAHMEKALDAVVARQDTLGPAGMILADRSIFIVTSIVIAGIVLGGFVSFVTARAFRRPMSRITENMVELANGNLDVEIDRSEDKNEIGQMNNALAVFQDNARKARDLAQDMDAARERQHADEREAQRRQLEVERQNAEKREKEQELAAENARMRVLEAFQNDMKDVLGRAVEGDFSRRMNRDVADENLRNLSGVINDLLDGMDNNIDQIVAGLGELANGNLDVRVTGDQAGVFLRMKDDFNNSVEQLARTMAQIMQNAKSVTLTSSELESASKQMAKRAEDNAHSVVETSAAIDEITASVQQVVSNAKSANNATQRVQDSAQNSRVVADKTEASISEMTNASEEINRVVGVIEDIAFQINLLALNAGVEAARAGEAGRGFSVVASEVRSLAQRSQDAVQEISGVIEQNTKSVEAGVSQVRLSRSALEDIISGVEVASGQILEITQAVEQQSSAIEDVNRAIQIVDGNAQSNAASLEELTAASVSLNMDASQLSQALDHFSGASGEATQDAHHSDDAGDTGATVRNVA